MRGFYIDNNSEAAVLNQEMIKYLMSNSKSKIIEPNTYSFVLSRLESNNGLLSDESKLKLLSAFTSSGAQQLTFPFLLRLSLEHGVLSPNNPDVKLSPICAVYKERVSNF